MFNWEKSKFVSKVNVLVFLYAEANQEPCVPSYVENHSEENLAPKRSLSKDIERSNFRKQNAFVDIRRLKRLHDPRSAIDSQQQVETSSLYLM